MLIKYIIKIIENNRNNSMNNMNNMNSMNNMNNMNNINTNKRYIQESFDGIRKDNSRFIFTILLIIIILDWFYCYYE